LRLARPKLPGRLLDPVGNCGARGMIATRSGVCAPAPGTESGLQIRSAAASASDQGVT